MDGASLLATGSVFARDFRVVRRLAEGGMGAVYVVDQISTSERRALKIMHPQFVRDAKSRERFDQEARVGARIRSNHVVRVIQAGVDEPTGTPWLCMELLEGQDLDTIASRKGRLPAEDVATIFEQACHALEEAHQIPVVHRDLKPENIFIAAPLSPGIPFTVKILDFGIAKLVQEARTTGGLTAAIGTPLWMAPEQAEASQNITPAADVWALGLIAFRLLTGVHYWRSANVENATMMAIYAEILTHPLAPAAERAAELGVKEHLPAGFDPWFARCVNRRLEERFPDAGQLRDGLLALLRGGKAATSTARRMDSGLLRVGESEPPPAPERPSISDSVAPTAKTAPLATTPGDRGRRRLALAIGAVAILGGVAVGFALRQSPSDPRREQVGGTELGSPAPAAPAEQAPAPPAVALPPSSEAPPAPIPVSAPIDRPRPAAPASPSATPSIASPPAPAPSPALARPAAPSPRPDPAPGPGAAPVAPQGRAPDAGGVSTAAPERPHVPGPSPATGQPPAQPARTPPAAADATPATATITVNCQPWATVRIGGRVLGTTPVGPIQVPVGTVRIVLEREGRPPMIKIEPVARGQFRAFNYRFP
ncbi:MAG: protein kinase [Deltaproteobacteria bacterium]|nr:protein kinase [Deltaproteobacteria bacterium]